MRCLGLVDSHCSKSKNNIFLPFSVVLATYFFYRIEMNEKQGSESKCLSNTVNICQRILFIF